MARAAIRLVLLSMPQKQVSVVAREELTYRGQVRSPGEVFEAALVDALVMGRKKRVVRVSRPFTARPVSPKGKRPGTYKRRDLTAESS